MLVFAHEALRDDDIELFLGPFEEDEELVRFNDSFEFPDMAVALKLFPSKGQARKNGWLGPIPEGYGERRYRKVYSAAWLQKSPYLLAPRYRTAIVHAKFDKGEEAIVWVQDAYDDPATSASLGRLVLQVEQSRAQIEGRAPHRFAGLAVRYV